MELLVTRAELYASLEPRVVKKFCHTGSLIATRLIDVTPSACGSCFLLSKAAQWPNNNTASLCWNGFPASVFICVCPCRRSLFVKSDGTLRKAGELFWNNDLLRTLRMIADEPSSFYSGQLASDMVADIQDAGKRLLQIISAWQPFPGLTRFSEATSRSKSGTIP